MAVLAVLAVGCGRFDFGMQADRPDLDAGRAAPDAEGMGLDAGPPGLDASGGGPARVVQTLGPGFVRAPSRPISILQTAGNLLVAAVYWDTSANTLTVSDTFGQAFHELPPEDVPSGCGAPGLGSEVRLWYAQIDSTGANTVTVTQMAGDNPLGMYLVELANIDPGKPVEASAGATATAATNLMSTGALTLTRPSVIIALFNDTLGGGSMAPGTDYSVLGRDADFYSLLESTVAAPGAYAPDGSLPAAKMDRCWTATAAAFAGR